MLRWVRLELNIDVRTRIEPRFAMEGFILEEVLDDDLWVLRKVANNPYTGCACSCVIL
jgi:hypothetical protein